MKDSLSLFHTNHAFIPIMHISIFNKRLMIPPLFDHRQQLFVVALIVVQVARRTKLDLKPEA